MIQLPPSLQHPHPVVFSRDSALARPSDDDPEALKKWEKAFEVARETGKYADVLIAGEEPTLFYVKPLAGSTARRLVDDRQAGRLGGMAFTALVFRLCIRSIANPTIEVKPSVDARYGAIADEEVTDVLDRLNPVIVNEIGSYCFERAASPSGK